VDEIAELSAGRDYRDHRLSYTPLSDPIASLEPPDYPALAASDIKVDRNSKFPVLLLAIATICQTIANARLQSELAKGCKAWWDEGIIKQ
jgi:hypothetical protein